MDMDYAGGEPPMDPAHAPQDPASVLVLVSRGTVTEVSYQGRLIPANIYDYDTDGAAPGNTCFDEDGEDYSFYRV